MDLIFQNIERLLDPNRIFPAWSVAGSTLNSVRTNSFRSPLPRKYSFSIWVFKYLFLCSLSTRAFTRISKVKRLLATFSFFSFFFRLLAKTKVDPRSVRTEKKRKEEKSNRCETFFKISIFPNDFVCSFASFWTRIPWKGKFQSRTIRNRKGCLPSRISSAFLQPDGLDLDKRTFLAFRENWRFQKRLFDHEIDLFFVSRQT